MELSELRMRLDVSEEDVPSAKLQLLLDDAIDWVQRVCRQDFVGADGNLQLPSVAKKTVAKYINFDLNSTDGVKKEEIGDTKFEYYDLEQLNMDLLKDLKAAGLITRPRLTFYPSRPRFESGVE